MSGFKEPGFADRQKAAQQAKKDLLNKFRAQPGPDDPEVAKRLITYKEELAKSVAEKSARVKLQYAGKTS